MEQVSIDLAKCTGCGVCAAICPYRAIGMTAGRAEHDGQACSLCGHCLAVCPAEAIVLAGLTPQLGLVTVEENILLAAHALGLGSCLIGFAVAALRRAPALRKAMMLPADEELYSVIALGRPETGAAAHHPSGRPGRMTIARWRNRADQQGWGSEYKRMRGIIRNPVLGF